MPKDPRTIAAQIEEGYAQALRGELIDGDEAIRILRERHTKRQAAEALRQFLRLSRPARV